jgi:two-component system cell cycle sensor histidine kinase/response regulator CckA
MAGLIQRLVGEHIEVRVLPATPLWDVRVDPSQLEQVLLNLVVNARDAMVNGGTLSIETGNVVLDDAYVSVHMGATLGPNVMLAVSDTGIGIERSIQDRIFEPFFTTKEQGKGTGLGLSMAFGIVNQSGGSIWVYSEPGKGATFKVFLPRTGVPDIATLRESEAPPPAHGNETVLLTEDEAAVRSVTRRILEHHGYTVLEARPAPKRCTWRSSHLLVTDVVMPKMSGRELAEQLLKARPTLKVLYVSGYTDDTIIHHGVLAEGVAFLQKPITRAPSLAR